MKYLITGGAGFLGTNLAIEVMRNGGELVIVDSLFRSGSEKNLAWLQEKYSYKYYKASLQVFSEIEKIFKIEKPDVVFHVAGQVAMTTSIENPRLDFEINAVGTLNILEAIRLHASEAALLYSSTNKVYGDLEDIVYEENDWRYVTPDFPLGFNEALTLSFHSPYGCSKGAADQYVLDYSRIFNLNTAVFRHSSIYGSRQFATYDQGWIGWFLGLALKIKSGKHCGDFDISGNGKQVRDILYIDDFVRLYFEAAKKIKKIKGNAFNVGGGIENSFSLLELFSFIELNLGMKMNFKKKNVRISDQKVFISNNEKAENMIGWKPVISKEKGIEKMLKWLESPQQ